MRDFVQNFPLFSIILCLLSSSGSTLLKGKAAKWLNTVVICICGAMSLILMVYCGINGSFTYSMGHVPAPWGNEVRGGVLEGGMGFFFCLIMLLSMMGGRKKVLEEVEDTKYNLYYILVNLMLCSLLALVYTNDLFTAYVFVEINTISACGLIMIRQIGRTFVAALRYMIMSQLGSGLFLVGICMIYDLTGHLLMSNIKESVAELIATGQYREPLLVAIAFLIVGLSIKSALFPFHAWLPDAYGYSTISSAAILSSLVSKGYIFLVIKIIYRVIGFEVLRDSYLLNVLFAFSLCAIVFGSVSAIRTIDIRRMIAYSSIAQIGYIYLGIGLGTKAGMIAAVFQILAHAATKSMLFISAIGMTDASNTSRKIRDLTGAAYRNRVAGAGFMAGALSMVGIPLFSGFISKLLFMEASVNNSQGKMIAALIVLAISTVLNAIYFMRVIIRIYSPEHDLYKDRMGFCVIKFRMQKEYTVAIAVFILLNILLGLYSDSVLKIIEKGIDMFA
ncbi:MAG: sodium:proton antiporter [Lachnospiraceae bacterium]|nr:sodium:proton antiporter [Lachnospiraceae bacterium]